MACFDNLARALNGRVRAQLAEGEIATDGSDHLGERTSLYPIRGKFPQVQNYFAIVLAKKDMLRVLRNNPAKDDDLETWNPGPTLTQ